jgi:chromosome segregation ATPase
VGAAGTDVVASAGRGEREATDQPSVPPPPRAPAAATGSALAPADDNAANETMIASLRTELAEETERRHAAEVELKRLKEETSVPPYPAAAAAGDLAAARDQIEELRRALAEEHAARERLAAELLALQQRPEPEAPAADESTPEAVELRARVEALRAEKDAIVDSFNRTLAASQERVSDLERQLSEAGSAAVAGAAAGATAEAESAAVRAENSALRARLDEEHRRTEELAAKLRVAMRVTDLIFKMRAQQAPSRSFPAP